MSTTVTVYRTTRSTYFKPENDLYYEFSNMSTRSEDDLIVEFIDGSGSSIYYGDSAPPIGDIISSDVHCVDENGDAYVVEDV